MDDLRNQKLDRSDSVPLYKQLIDLVKQQIESGVFLPGELLASERELCKQYEVSLITVRQALVQLSQSGWVNRVAGKGTYVAERRGVEPSGHGAPLGVVLPESEHLIGKAFSADFMFGFGAVSGEFEYNMKLYSALDVQYLEDVLNKRVQGLVVTGVEIPQWRLLQKAGIPFVLIGDWDEEGVYVVDVDNVNVSDLQTTHLLESGCKRIGFINAQDGQSPFSMDRLEGYRRTLRRAEFPADPRLIQTCDFSAESGYDAARELLRHKVDGLVAVDDVVATGAAKAVLDSGLRIPEDVRIIGCNNTSLSESFQPALSSVDIEPSRLGRLAGEKLIQLLRSENPPLRNMIPGHLVVRESTAGAGTPQFDHSSNPYTETPTNRNS